MMSEVVFWLDTVPQVCKGVFNEVSRQWNGKCFYVVSNEIDDNRKLINSESDFGNAEIVYLYEKGDYRENGIKFIESHAGAIHIFNGYRSKTSIFLDYLCKKKREDTKIVIWAERPLPKWKTNFPFSFYHLKYAWKYRDKIDAFLPLGHVGIETYARLGWRKNKMYPFLYLPIMDENLPKHEEKNNDLVQFVYLGRFSESKGVDVLMDACESLSSSRYKITLVGGYGPIKDKVINWCKSFPQAEFGGTWPIDEAVSRLFDYDVCIIPSRYDGWNVTTNEALMAAIGVIISDEAVSDEMVTASGAGIVVKAGNKDELAQAMKSVIDNANTVSAWKNAAYDYRKKMSAKICAHYFVDILDHIQGILNERPRAPWIS